MSRRLDLARWWARLVEAVTEWWEKRAIAAWRRVRKIEERERRDGR